VIRHVSDYSLPDPGDDAPELELPWWLDEPYYPGDEAEQAAWVAALPADVRAEYEAGPWTGAGESIPAGFLHRGHDGPLGVGFASGGTIDTLAPSPLLAEFAVTATAAGHADLGESELIGVLCAWQRLASWSHAGLAAAAIALAKRRDVQSRQLQNPHLTEHVSDELAAALRLTGRSAGRLLELSAGLARMDDVLAALKAGRIDWAKASLFAEQLASLPGEEARAVAAKLLGQAEDMTTGQLRAALASAVLEIDPEAARQRKDAARRDTEVQTWTESSGNGALAGRELPRCEVIAADQRLTRLAEYLSSHGVPGSISQLRALAYSALLAGRPIQSMLPPACTEDAPSPPGDDAPGADDDGADRGWPRLTGTINLTLPLSAWLGLTGTAGEVGGHGPVDATSCRELISLMDPATGWCLTLTGTDDRAVAHACAPHGPPSVPGPQVIAWAAGLRERLQILEAGTCSHARRSAAYQPPRALRHLIQIRHRTCAFPGCRRAAMRCDLDHTQAFDQGGITCECNLAPLCRWHHQAKQAWGSMLKQPEPGRLTWHLPHSRSYTTVGDSYPG